MSDILLKQIEGGVVAAKGFVANGIHCGIRKNRTKRDLALIVCDTRATAAAVYTQNLVKGAPLIVSKKHLLDGYAQAMICNSGNANTCNANGVEIAEGVAALAGTALGISPKDIVVASTGVIGQPMSLAPFRNGMTELVAGLGAHSDFAAEAIMTTDLKKKEIAYQFSVGGKLCRIGGIAKGSGMIAPNMATMLVFITTDVAITSEMLQAALSEDIRDTFNMLSVDGDTSTNDQVTILASGHAGNNMITGAGADFDAFATALHAVHDTLCRAIAADGEGATKSIEVCVSGAIDRAAARTVAKSVVTSNLVKAACFGADANWGRVLCAIGYSGVPVDITGVRVEFQSQAGTVTVCENGAGVDFDEPTAHQILLMDEIKIIVTLSDGKACATAYGCDLTYEYVKINADYRT